MGGGIPGTWSGFVGATDTYLLRVVVILGTCLTLIEATRSAPRASVSPWLRGAGSKLVP